MKQILQNIGNGSTSLEDIPVPAMSSSEVLIRSSASLVSTGTERMLVNFGKASMLVKARQQPDKVKMVLDKVMTDGLQTTYEAVKSKLEQEVSLGYANVGTVVEVGEDVAGFRPGDRLVSNGKHAEFVVVGKNLCAKIPDNVTDLQASFTVPASIALQGIRLAEPTIGECFVVTGLGLIGLLAVQVLRANGCRVIGIDMDESKLALARSFGATTVNVASGEDPIEVAASVSRGRGVDGVIIAASSPDNSIVHQSATMCRKRGRIILVGVVGLGLQRSDFYEKELYFQVSCSYGPGRYDPNYEESGHDYPEGFVRWTEQRNFEAILDMLSSGQLEVDQLISAQYPIDKARNAYEKLSNDPSVLGLLLQYPNSTPVIDGSDRVCAIASERTSSTASGSTVGAIGAGNYAGRVLLPAFKSAGANLRTVVSNQGVSGTAVGKNLGFFRSATDVNAVFDDERINTVVIATRHDSHAEYIVRAIRSGKHVFVEKPLALSLDEVDAIELAYDEACETRRAPILMIGFNRRFAPLVRRVKNHLDHSTAPISLIYNCNAGRIDASSWVHDRRIGGGRIVGEACHFIDLARFLSGSRITNILAAPMIETGSNKDCRDTVSINLQFENGSIAVINYFSNGHRSFPKERFEVHQAGRVMVLDNYRSLRSYGGAAGNKTMFRSNRGQKECVRAFVEAVNSGSKSPIDFREILEVSRVAIQAANSVQV